jgi:Methyltransferase domain
MLAESAERISQRLSDEDVVLDLGGWAQPFVRADWVIDLMPYETRAQYGRAGSGEERFGPDTWIERDLCDRKPLPFRDGEIDFAICSHTLEDVRDPVWVCAELNRVAKAGYIEVPSRLEEQSRYVNGPWVGWSHHRWLIDVEDPAIVFVAKPHLLHANEHYRFPDGFAEVLTPDERVQTLFWEGGFSFRERIFFDPDELDAYLAGFVAEQTAMRRSRLARRGPLARLRRAVGALRS